MSVVNDFLEELRKVIEVRGRGYQAEIARAMGLNEPTFSNMVSGRRGISEELRKEIAKYTGIDLERILVNNGFISQRGGDKNLSTTNQSGGVNLNAEDATGNVIASTQFVQVADPRINELIGILKRHPYLIDMVLEWTKRKVRDMR